MQADSVFKPRVLISVYASDSRTYSGGVEDGQSYIEYAPVIDNKPGAFVPMSSAMATDLSILLGNAARVQVGGFIPDNVMYLGFTGFMPSIMWYTKPQQKRILFEIGNKKDAYTVLLPYLVWYYDGQKLRLFAAKEKPTQKTKLFKAPFCNINADSVCLGAGTKLLDKNFGSYQELMEKVELAFFGTYFNHQTATGIVKGNLISVYKKLTKTKEAFPLSILNPCGKSVKSAISNEKDTDIDPEDQTNEEVDFDENEL